MMNNKAISGLMAVLIFVAIIIVGGVAAAFMLGSPEAVNNGDITVYIDSKKQSVNYTSPQTLDWGNIQAGNSYTKNFTVVNTGAQTYQILLLTTEPAGTSQTWAYNNSALATNNYAAGSLTLTLSISPSTGSYTWRLLATNSTEPLASPTPGPSSTPTPNSIQYTISADMGITSINVTRNSGLPITLLQEQLPKTYLITPGDSLKLQQNVDPDYTFNGWEFGDGTMPTIAPYIIIANIQGNFTITAQTYLTPLT
jgi:flagellin-like protein